MRKIDNKIFYYLGIKKVDLKSRIFCGKSIVERYYLLGLLFYLLSFFYYY